jgi:hypothetical protein
MRLKRSERISRLQFPGNRISLVFTRFAALFLILTVIRLMFESEALGAEPISPDAPQRICVTRISFASNTCILMNFTIGDALSFPPKHSGLRASVVKDFCSLEYARCCR